MHLGWIYRESRKLAAAAVVMGATGCSAKPPLEVDAGASPFAPLAKTDEAAIPDADGRENAVERAAAAAGPLNTAMGANEVERQLRRAMSLGEKGDLAKSAELIDQVLAAEPINREALLMRGIVAVEQSQRAKTPAEREQAAAKGKEIVKTLERAYENLKKQEVELLNRVRLADVLVVAAGGKTDQAVALLGDATRRGFDTLERARVAPELAALRETPAFKTLTTELDQEFLVKARVRTAKILAKPLNLPFDFKLNDLENKPVALADFRGKVVVIDFWGTWCGPCVQTIPHLMEFYKRKHAQGLEIVGLTYEKGASNDDEAREILAAFLKKIAVPYPLLLGDEKTILQVPGFKGFPTSLVIDRAGKVRLLITENDENSFNTVRDVATVLLEEPAPAAAAAKAR